MPVAELEDVVKRYGAVKALDGVGLEIGRGELVALLGENGAGKTTLVRLLLGLAAPSAGRVAVFGQRPGDREARLRTGAMLQSARVPEALKVREHIELFASYYPAPLSLKETLAAAALEPLENRLYAKLSGGERQKVLFALAICGNPELLFLDEPTVGLDVETRRALWEHIRRFVERGGTVLLTTHYLEEADALATRVAVLRRGRIVGEGTPAQIKARAAVKKVRCVTSLTEAALKEIAGAGRVASMNGHVEILAPDSDRVVRALLESDPAAHDLEVVAGGLEEAFLKLTGEAA